MTCESCRLLKASGIQYGFLVCPRCAELPVPVCNFCDKGECQACRSDVNPCACASEGHPNRRPPELPEDYLDAEERFLAGEYGDPWAEEERKTRAWDVAMNGAV